MVKGRGPESITGGKGGRMPISHEMSEEERKPGAIDLSVFMPGSLSRRPLALGSVPTFGVVSIDRVPWAGTRQLHHLSQVPSYCVPTVTRDHYVFFEKGDSLRRLGGYYVEVRSWFNYLHVPVW
jgi:hypothetical protein